MEVNAARVPSGPGQPYRIAEDLLEWMGRQFCNFGDTYKATVYGASTYVTKNPDFAYHVLVENWQNYIKGQMIQRVALLLGNGLMVSEGELWKRQRRMIQPAFSHDSIAAVAKLITIVNSQLLRKWQLAAEKNESINVTRDVSSMAMEVVLRFIFGVDYERVGSRFNLLSDETARNMDFARLFRPLRQIILELINERRTGRVVACSYPDALSTLICAADPKSGAPMADQQIVDEAVTLIVAGHETTASTLNWTWYLLSQHAEVEQKLSAELEVTNFSDTNDLPAFPYTRQIIEEAMRLYPAGWLVTRKALRDDRLGDFFVPAGTEIYIPLYFIQRHPELWAEPDRFDPDRFRPGGSTNRHRLATIPFSVGPRNCIGSIFARVEMQIHLLIIAKHLRLRYAESKPVQLDAGVNLRSKSDFIMYPGRKVNVKSTLVTSD